MLRLLLGLLALALGLLLAAGDAFLLAWEAAAGPSHDIAARGPWLLALYAPAFAGGAALLAVVVATVPRRHCWRSAGTASAMAVVVVLGVAALLYADPTGAVWRILGPTRAVLRAPGTVILDAVLVLVGGWLVARPAKATAASLSAAI